MKLRLSMRLIGAGASVLILSCSGDGGLSSDENAAIPCDRPVRVAVTNLAICARQSNASTPPLVFSSYIAAGKAECDSVDNTFPPPLPKEAWGKLQLSSSFASKGRACVSLRQGDPKHPSDVDCVLATQCVDFDYAGDDSVLELPLAAWRVSDDKCAYKYEANNGYFEFKLEDATFGCLQRTDDVEPTWRKGTCPIACAAHPKAAACVATCKNADQSFDNQD